MLKIQKVAFYGACAMVIVEVSELANDSEQPDQTTFSAYVRYIAILYMYVSCFVERNLHPSVADPNIRLGGNLIFPIISRVFLCWRGKSIGWFCLLWFHHWHSPIKDSP